MSQNWYGQGFDGGKYDVGIQTSKNSNYVQLLRHNTSLLQGKNPNITLNNQNIIFIVKKLCVFHENRYFQGLGTEKYDGDVKILKKIEFWTVITSLSPGKKT